MISSEREEFVIVFVDDNLKSKRPQIAEIEEFLKQKGKKMILLPDEENGGRVLEYLRNYDVDIVVTDNSMENEGDGLKILEMVRNTNELVDLLLFSAKDLVLSDYKQACHHTSVEIVEGSNIVDNLEKLIEKNLQKWNDIIFLRGIAISRVVELESEINSFLERYFKLSDSDGCRFRNFVLENRYVSLEAKKKILSKIAEHEKIKFDGLGKLNTIQEKRNFLAHCKKHPMAHNCLIHMGDEEPFTPDKMKEIFEMILEFLEKMKTFENAIKEKINT